MNKKTVWILVSLIVVLGLLVGVFGCKAPAATPTPTTPTPTNWGLIGGLIAAAIVIIVLLVYFLWWRRRFV